MKAVALAEHHLFLAQAMWARSSCLYHCNACLTVIALGSGGKVRAEAKRLLEKLEARDAH